MSKKIIVVLLTLSCLWNLSAQDLLESTVKGLKKKEQTKTNLIAESILKKASFEPKALFTYVGNELSKEDRKYLDQVIRIKLDPSSLRSIGKEKSNTLRLSIPVSQSNSFHLLMEKVDVLEPGYFVETSDGQITYPDLNKIVFYRGIVEGNNNSLVSLTIVDEEIRLLISDEEGNYSITRDSKKNDIWNLYNEKNLKNKSERKKCGSNNTMIKESLDSHKGKNTKMMMKNIQIYVEVDFLMYQAHGNSDANVQAFVMALINGAATIFTNEQINISMSSSFIWKSAPPYRNADSGFALEDFGMRLKDNYTGRLAHFITTFDYPDAGGIAWTDVLCDSYNTFTDDLQDGQGNILHHAGPYGISSSMSTTNPSFTANSNEVATFAHEIGHNIGSQHTHGCVWGPTNNEAIDNCAATEGNCGVIGGVATPAAELGTIMSYCDNVDFTKGFGTEPGAFIRERYNNAMCITVPDGGGCPVDATVSATTTSGNSLASNSVSTSGNIVVNGAAVFSSNNIHLNNGFEVPSGNCFEANNVGCTYTGVLTCGGGGGGTSCTNHTNTADQDIPDLNQVVSIINVGEAKTINEVELINITGNHSYLGDLAITLTSPDNTTIVVKLFDGAFTCNSNFDLGFDDDATATTLVCNTINPGIYKPNAVLSGFDGKSSNGTWTLTVADLGEGDTGRLTGWGLRICGTLIPGFIDSDTPISKLRPVESSINE